MIGLRHRVKTGVVYHYKMVLSPEDYPSNWVDELGGEVVFEDESELMEAVYNKILREYLIKKGLFSDQVFVVSFEYW